MNYKEKIKEVIALSWFVVDAHVYVFASVAEIAECNNNLMTICEFGETTVVTTEDNLTHLTVYNRNSEPWRLITIRCGKPFYCVGFIATITSALAEAGIDITITSSFQNDLVMVSQNDLVQTISILEQLGFENKTV